MQSLKRRIEKISVGKDDLTVFLVLDPDIEVNERDLMKIAWLRFRELNRVIRKTIPAWFKENVRIYAVKIWRPSPAQYHNRLLESTPDE